MQGNNQLVEGGLEPNITSSQEAAAKALLEDGDWDMDSHRPVPLHEQVCSFFFVLNHNVLLTVCDISATTHDV